MKIDYLMPQFYCDADWFYLEKKNYFPNMPNLIGHESQFINSTFTKVMNVAGVDSFIKRNSEQQFMHYVNSCPHRWARLVEESTDKPLICKYHNINYSLKHCEKKLEGYTAKNINGFLFSNLFDMNKKLEAELKTRTSSFHKHIGAIKVLYKANWKIIVENTLETSHVPAVHPNFPKIDLSKQDVFFINDDFTLWEAEVLENSMKRSVNKYFNCETSMFGKYYIIHFSPFSFISSVNGISSSMVHLNPISEKETEVYIDVYLADMQPNKFSSLIEKQMLESTFKIFDEDRVVCELVQKGAQARFDADLFGPFECWPNEIRIKHFQKSYIRGMGSACD